jgi:glycerol-3-phosphate acyltransferase
MQVICLVSEAEKKNCQVLPMEKYPKPLIFHDGRLVFRPTPLAFLVMLMWAPLGFLLCLIRAAVAILLPFKISMPILGLLGMKCTVSRPSSSVTSNNNNHEEKSKGILYVCNHRTLIDPIYVSVALMKPVIAATYSLSTITELFSPLKTIRLTRNKEEDSKKMEEQLSQGNLVVCPEGTTCREPYLLRFSPLFAETTDEIVPIAIDIQVGMFYGTTACGFKCLDPVFLLMNPTTSCTVNILEKLPRDFTCGVGGKSKFEVANHVQAMIAEALLFECTNLTRKDKYMILAGNEGKI